MRGVSRIDVTEEVALVSFSRIPLDLAFISEIFASFSRNGIILDMISQTAPVGDNCSISFTCLDADMVKVLSVSKDFSTRHPSVVPLVTSGNCKIQLYGEEMRATHGVFARAIAALAKTGIEIKQITTSEVDISILVCAMHLDAALEAVKTAFGIM